MRQVGEAVIDHLRLADRAIILGLARRLRRVQTARTGLVRNDLFYAVAAVHALAVVALCLLTAPQPEWLWAVSFAATGAVALFLLDSQPELTILIPIEDGIALTEFGHSDRWMLGRLTYLAVAVVGTFGLLFDPTYSGSVLAVFATEMVALGIMEYLLCFRLVDYQFERPGEDHGPAVAKAG